MYFVALSRDVVAHCSALLCPGQIYIQTLYNLHTRHVVLLITGGAVLYSIFYIPHHIRWVDSPPPSSAIWANIVIASICTHYSELALNMMMVNKYVTGRGKLRKDCFYTGAMNNSLGIIAWANTHAFIIWIQFKKWIV